MEPIDQALEFLRARTQTCQLHRLGGNHLEELAKGIAVNFILNAQATVGALQAIIKQMGEQACVLAKDGMAAKAQVEALQRERDHAKKMAVVQKEVADNQTWHVRELTAALDAEREEVAFVEKTAADFQALWRTACDQREDFETQLTQLKALVREVDSLLKGIIKRNQGGYAGDKDDIRKAISLIAILDAPPTERGKG